jgi:hypothetical protein
METLKLSNSGENMYRQLGEKQSLSGLSQMGRILMQSKKERRLSSHLSLDYLDGKMGEILETELDGTLRSRRFKYRTVSGTFVDFILK